MAHSIITTIDLLRHGECEGGDIYRGTTDVSLTEKGMRQMEEAVSSVVAVSKVAPWQKIISSPLQRCRRFSQAQGLRMNVPVVIENDFREVDFGDWEGRTLKDVWKMDANAVDQFYRSPDKFPPPNGENLQEVLDRLTCAWKRTLGSHSGEHLLLVQHGGTIRVLISWLLQMPLTAVTRLHVPYASFSRIEIFETDGDFFPRLKFLNRISENSSDY